MNENSIRSGDAKISKTGQNRAKQRQKTSVGVGHLRSGSLFHYFSLNNFSNHSPKTTTSTQELWKSVNVNWNNKSLSTVVILCNSLILAVAERFH